jgi:hypothetical protein
LSDFAPFASWHQVSKRAIASARVEDSARRREVFHHVTRHVERRQDDVVEPDAFGFHAGKCECRGRTPNKAMERNAGWRWHIRFAVHVYLSGVAHLDLLDATQNAFTLCWG